MRGGVGSRLARWLPWVVGPTMIVALGLIFVVVPTERTQGIVQRIFYVHVPSAWAAFAGFLVVAVASVRAGAVPLERVRPAAHTLVLFGNEGHGLPPALVDGADVELTIPMRNGVDSLNVASAAAVILWALGDPRPAVQ